jgi:hypothetical protein
MITILDNYIKDKHFYSDPFPHIIIENCLDEGLYSLLEKNFPSNENFLSESDVGNQPYWIMGSNLRNLSSVWADFVDAHNSREFFYKAAKIISPLMTSLDPDYLTNLGKELIDCTFGLAEVGRENNPLNKKNDIVISVALGINTPCKTKSVIEPPHNDFPQKLFNSLLYMRKEGDDSPGGDLVLYKTKNKFLFTSKSDSVYWVDEKYLTKIKTIKYSKNVLVMFPQRYNAVHGVTARGPTPHTRRYININMESYVLKRSAFFKTPRSLYGRIKFKILDTTLFKSLKKYIRPYYIFLRENFR